MTSSAQGIRAGRAYVEVGTNNRPLDTGLAAATRSVRTWVAGAEQQGRRLALFGAGITTGLVAMAKGFADNGVQVAKLRNQTGLTTLAIAGLRKAGEDAEVPFAELSKMLTKLQANIAKPTEETAKAWERMGSSVEAVRAMPLVDAISMLADRLPKVRDENERVATAIALFGKSGAAILPILEKGSRGLNEATAEAKKLGLVMSDETLDAALKLDDAFDKLAQSTRGLRDAIGEGLVPVLVPVLDKVSEIVKEFGAWAKENPGLAQSLLGVAAGITAIGTALATAGLVAGGAGVVGAAGRGVGRVLGSVGSGAAAAIGLRGTVAGGAAVLDGATGTALGRAASGGVLRTVAGGVARALGPAGLAYGYLDATGGFDMQSLNASELSPAERDAMIARAKAEHGGGGSSVPQLSAAAWAQVHGIMRDMGPLFGGGSATTPSTMSAPPRGAAAAAASATSVDGPFSSFGGIPTQSFAERLGEKGRKEYLGLIRKQLAALVDGSGGRGRIADVMGSGVDVVGRFGGIATSQIGFGSSVEQRNTKAVEETARNTRDIARSIREGSVYQ